MKSSEKIHTKNRTFLIFFPKKKCFCNKNVSTESFFICQEFFFFAFFQLCNVKEKLNLSFVCTEFFATARGFKILILQFDLKLLTYFIIICYPRIGERIKNEFLCFIFVTIMGDKCDLKHSKEDFVLINFKEILTILIWISCMGRLWTYGTNVLIVIRSCVV